MATAKWLGTASLELEHNGKILLIDPFVTRGNKWDTFTKPLVPDATAIDAYLDGLDGKVLGIVITHAHSDHLQDTAYFAAKLDVPVWGNESVDTFLKIHGLPGCAQVLTGGEKFAIGPFTIEPIRTRHGLVALGRVPFAGSIDPQRKPPLRVWHFRHGDPPLLLFVTAGGKTLFHQGTANLIDNLLPVRAVDSAWVCASGYQKTVNFVARFLARVQPRRVLPFHFEDFSLPLTEHTRYIPGSDPVVFGEKFKQLSADLEIRVPKPYEAIEF